ncbi:MAG: hypothetical protein AVDCRST_MAG12-1140 [uncultured Rubrobacteraceae bacterium]|uniref:Uncharacterized protein n=1 Tax=uncultured Rubrobacteraceae bacterium TaxID=349277 RepID=A0A6J4RK18_9ACTN|nr:MAG: hypothetical protein AVDCRST_MAG12-1140 [uncultured Rubrobacteraceae bacterium]
MTQTIPQRIREILRTAAPNGTMIVPAREAGVTLAWCTPPDGRRP